MLFSSITFLYYFLPCVILLYFAAPKALKNTVLLLFSLVFYAWGEPRYVFLMIATVLVCYVLGILVEKTRGRFLSKVFLCLALLFCLGALGYFKYADFFIANFNKVTGLGVPLLKIALPIGISFYTFQILSYVIDVYRGDVKAQKNPLTLATYVALFPQLIAGPIVRYCDVEKQLTDRSHSIDKVSVGIRRFIMGLSKKILLANTLGELCVAFNASDEKSVMFYWLFVIAYMLQIYFDFSGYSDMAIGLGKIFGFDFLENFNYPFISRSASEFWRRWHMSLGSWFRDYVYIPMGGNRVNKLRFFINIFTVWFLTGFWHGAEWNFIVWGLYFAVFLLVEKFFLVKKLEKSRVLSRIYTLLIVAVSFAIFSGNSLTEALTNAGGLFGVGTDFSVTADFLYNLRSYGVVVLIAIIASTPLPKLIKEKLEGNNVFKTVWGIIEIPLLLGLLILSTAYLADGAFNPFLYFRF
ncbi:MAG: MBOAT family protein [Clostridia bacterium]|nr:MBOAT family protein [Clostridia bacterium]